MARSVLFVCTANICRSPMAEALFRQIVGAAGNTGWRIESAGTWASEGQPAAQNTQEVLLERGIDASEHRSRLINRELIEAFNLVLVMERSHKEALQVEFPVSASRVFLLSEMVGKAHDVYDPIGGPLIEFEDMAGEIENYLTEGFEQIKSLADGKGAFHFS